MSWERFRPYPIPTARLLPMCVDIAGLAHPQSIDWDQLDTVKSRVSGWTTQYGTLAKRHRPFLQLAGKNAFRTHLIRNVLLLPRAYNYTDTPDSWMQRGMPYRPHARAYCGQGISELPRWAKAAATTDIPEGAQLCPRCIKAAGLLEMYCDLGYMRPEHGYYCTLHPLGCKNLPQCAA